jgi:putative flippase GtrA
LRAAWTGSEAAVVGYMDVDLSTDLDALLPLVAPLVSGHSDVAIGTRLASTAQVSRGPRREAVSRVYNLILRAALHAGFSDAQCGFKAVRTDVAKALLPMVEDQGWFFDTELLVLAEHNGMRIHEVPVDWVDDPDSRVHIASTARDDLRGVWRMMRGFARGDGVLPAPLVDTPMAPKRPTLEQLVRFVSIGAVSTVLFALLFLLLHGTVGAVAADVIALAVCTVVNTVANRRLTFNLRGRSRRVRHQLRGLVAGLLPLALNLLALAVAAAFGVTEAVPLVLVLTAANAVASLVKFVLLQHWVFVARPAARPLAARAASPAVR